MSGRNDDTAGFVVAIIGLAAIITAVIIFMMTAAILLPLIAAGTALFGGAYYYFHSPAYLEKKAREHTLALYHSARAQYQSGSPEELALQLVDSLPEAPATLIQAIGIAAWEIVEQDGVAVLPEPPVICNSVEGARYRDKLSRITEFPSPARAQELLTEAFTNFLYTLPVLEDAGEESFTVPLIDVLRDPGKSIEALILPLYSEPGLFTGLKRRLDHNAAVASGGKDFLLPTDYEGENIAYTYLKDTPLLALLDARVPITIKREKWFEHGAIWGTPGKGKTTLIQALIAHHLPAVARNEASIFIMDSQGTGPEQLIHCISNLKEFAPGGPLDGKLLYIEPDPVHPFAMNPFLMGRDRKDMYSERDREQLHNQTIELISYIFSSQGEGGSFTLLQGTLYRYCVELLLEVPNANLTMFQQLLLEGIEPFSEHIPKLSPPAQTFFYKQFKDRQFQERAKEVAARLAGVLQNRAIAGMFDATECKLDLYTELASSKVIVISADVNYLGAERCMLYGRTMIALLLRAAQERAPLARKDRMPVYCFIDEAHDYIKNDPKIVTIFDQARKMNVSMVVANQRTGQLTGTNVADAVLSTAIQFASTDNEADTHKLAPIMHTTPEFLHRQPRHHFALSVSGLTDRAVSVRVPLTLSKRDWMTQRQFTELRAALAARYSAVMQHPNGAGAEPTETERPPQAQGSTTIGRGKKTARSLDDVDTDPG